MVGLLGCGCCGPTQTELCTSASFFQNQIVEDFSPTFDPYFSPLRGDIRVLETKDGHCQINQQSYNPNSYASQGALFGRFKKSTLELPVEAFLKLHYWFDAAYVPGPAYIPAINARLAIDAYYDLTFPPFLSGNYTAAAYANFNSSNYQFRAGLFSISIPIRPKTGDVFGIRLSDFTITSSFPNTMIKPKKAEFVLNGQTIYTVIDQSVFVSFNACNFATGFFISEPRAGARPGSALWVKVDDFTHSSL
jgi:hypothetical protein